MICPPLCIIQARYHSTRLPGKMCLRLADETLIARAVRIARTAFGPHVVVSAPATDRDTPLGEEIAHLGAPVAWWPGDEADVLGRFHAVAHQYRWHPSAVIVRYTPDDFRKTHTMLRRVAAGERLPVEQGGEAFLLALLGYAETHTRPDDPAREHIGNNLILFPAPAPAPPDDGFPWSIDTAADFDAAERWMDAQRALLGDTLYAYEHRAQAITLDESLWGNV